MIGVCFDISERVAAEEQQRLLVNELNHRVKNTLAIVQSLAQQTLREGREPALAKQAFEERLHALSAAHDVLTQQNWESASIGAIVAKTLAPHEGERSRIAISGPDLPLMPQAAVTLALAMHELATNAAKYGALSRPEGRVEVSWQVAEGRLKLVWQERGGPVVAEPLTRGFGTRMIERALAAELQGEVAIEFRATGLVCTVDAPWPGV